MLNVIIIDSSATERHFWHQKVSTSLQDVELVNSRESLMIPNVSLNTLAPEEINYHQPANLYLIGEELITQQPGLLHCLKDKNPKAAIIVVVGASKITSLPQLENLIRNGVDDLISPEIRSLELVIKLIVQSQKIDSGSIGKIILIESAKGGQGATTICGAIGEALALTNQRILLIDLDCDSQDLSRYLQARPYFNENLSEVLRGDKLLTKESFADCITSINQNIAVSVLTPANFEDYQNQKILTQLISFASQEFDYILIDASSQRVNDLNVWYRLCRDLILIVTNDPASCFSSIIKLKQICTKLTKKQRVLLLENRLNSKGLSSKSVRQQISSQIMLEADCWIQKNISWSSSGYCWPASGKTFYGLSGSHNQQALKNCVELLMYQAEPIRLFSRAPLVFPLVWNYFKNIINSCQKQIVGKKVLLVERGLIELPRITDTPWDESLLDDSPSVGIKNFNS